MIWLNRMNWKAPVIQRRSFRFKRIRKSRTSKAAPNSSPMTETVGFVGVDDKYLAWLYIHPDYYRQGMRRRLLQSGLEVIGEGAWTVVLAGNANANQLYLSEGFREVRGLRVKTPAIPAHA